MRTGSFIAVVAVLAALFTGAGVLYFYDNSRDDLIAEGVTVGGIEVGGMRADKAERTLRAAYESRLEQPLKVSYEEKSFTLTPRQAGLQFDFTAMVDEAVSRSREGSIVSRVWRSARGEQLNEDVSPASTYSAAAVSRFIRTVEKKVERPAKNATLNFDSAAPEPRRGKEGIRVNATQLRTDVEAILSSSAAARTLKIPAKKFKPKITLAKLADSYPELIIVNRSTFKLTFYRHLKVEKSYTVAIGAIGFGTPAGLYRIQNKAVNPTWSVPNKPWAGSLAGQQIPGGTPQNPLKARWLGIFDGAGIHGTDAVGSLGSAASHGCVRMAIPDVIELYDKVPVGAPIYIA